MHFNTMMRFSVNFLLSFGYLVNKSQPLHTLPKFNLIP